MQLQFNLPIFIFYSTIYKHKKMAGESDNFFFPLLCAILVVSLLILILLLGHMYGGCGSDSMMAQPNNFSKWWLGNGNAGSGIEGESTDNITNSLAGGILIDNISSRPPNEGSPPSVMEEQLMAESVYPDTVSSYLSTELNQEDAIQSKLFKSN